MEVSYFVGKAGENSSAVPEYEGAGLKPNHILAINKQEDLSGIIEFNDGGCVYGITLSGSPGIYDYVLNVDAKGPSGAFSGSGHLKFTDETGDVYTLGIYSSTRSVHTVRYSSSKPNIVKVEWSN